MKKKDEEKKESEEHKQRQRDRGRERERETEKNARNEHWTRGARRLHECTHDCMRTEEEGERVGERG